MSPIEFTMLGIIIIASISTLICAVQIKRKLGIEN